MATQSPSFSATNVRLGRVEPQHVSELGRICYEAFKGVQEHHGFAADLPSVSIARQVLGMLVEREDFYGVVALVDGQPVGSNFSSLMDDVAGVGPITIDCAFQGGDIGRALMKDVIEYARSNRIAQVRLQQDAFNVVSLSLYASLGFEAKHATAVMQPGLAASDDGSVRRLEESDLPAVEELSRRIYRTSRLNEVSSNRRFGFLPLVRERNGRVTGYLMPGLFGHGVAATEGDALSLVNAMSIHVSPEQAYFFCPLSQTAFFKGALQQGCRVIKVMNLMAIGPYEEPGAVWMPSVLY